MTAAVEDQENNQVNPQVNTPGNTQAPPQDNTQENTPVNTHSNNRGNSHRNFNTDENIGRVMLPNKRKGEMFGIVEKLSGGSHLSVMCEDGFTRVTRIPGKMKKRMWIREKDLVIVKPWQFQNEKADIVYRYTQTQSNYLRRNGSLPEIINIFK